MCQIPSYPAPCPPAPRTCSPYPVPSNPSSGDPTIDMMLQSNEAFNQMYLLNSMMTMMEQSWMFLLSFLMSFLQPASGSTGDANPPAPPDPGPGPAPLENEASQRAFQAMTSDLN